MSIATIAKNGALSLSLLVSAATAASEPLIEHWVALAWERHPDGQAARLLPEVERVQIAGTGAWMPPQSELDIQSDGLTTLKLSQMIPWPGKISAMRRSQQGKTEMARADSAKARQELARSVREAAWMEWMAREKLAVLRSQAGIVQNLSESATRNLSQGMGSAAEAWLTRARSESLESQVQSTEAELAAARAMRESWTGKSQDSLSPALPERPNWDDSALVQASLKRPDIEAMRREAHMREAMKAASERALKPDLMGGVMLMRMTNGMPGVGVMAGMSLPFAPWARGMTDGNVAAEEVRGRLAALRGAAMGTMARAQIADHAARARGAWKALRRLDSLVTPGQESALEETRRRYAQGREMLAMVLAMEEMVRMTRMEAIMRRGEYELEKVRLADAAGLDDLGGAR